NARPGHFSLEIYPGVLETCHVAFIDFIVRSQPRGTEMRVLNAQAAAAAALALLQGCSVVMPTMTEMSSVILPGAPAGKDPKYHAALGSLVKGFNRCLLTVDLEQEVIRARLGVEGCATTFRTGLANLDSQFTIGVLKQ